MSHGIGKRQRAILEVLEEKGGRASTSTLKKAIVKTSDQNFYRALGNLQKRNLVKWYKSQGGINSPSGLVSITRKKVLCVDADSYRKSCDHEDLSIPQTQGHDVTLQRGLKISNNNEKYEFIYRPAYSRRNRWKSGNLQSNFQGNFQIVRYHSVAVELTSVLNYHLR